MTVKIASLFALPHQHHLSSSFSLSTETMSSRDHPFNRSTRPLLGDRKPQLLIRKKIIPAAASATAVLDPSRNSKVYGFNDFNDIMSQQYKHINTHIGYPYGSPPSPTVVNSNDFVFSDNMSNTVSGHGGGVGGKLSGRSGAGLPQQGVGSGFYPSRPRISGGSYGSTNEIYSRPTVDVEFGDDGLNCWQNAAKQHQQKHHHHVEGHRAQMNARMTKTTSGPFIFGVHSANTGKNYRTVISETKKYSNDVKNGSEENGFGRLISNQSNSDTSTSSNESKKDRKQLFKDRRKDLPKKGKRKAKKLNKDKKFPNIKCVLVGDGAVGKTNLIVSYLKNRFLDEHVPTASDIYNAEVMVNESPVHITLCDTAGQDTLDPLRELCYPDSDVFLLCFSVVNPETFRSIKDKWAPKFSKTKASLILVGTQADLRNDSIMLHKLQMQGTKPVSPSDAWDLATSIGAKYIETSSFTQEKVKDVFDAAIWDAFLPQNLPPTPPLWKKLFCLV